MRTITITKEVTFDAAHRLSFHSGKCANLHGHTYRLQATFAKQVYENGMIEDFYNIKQLLETVVEPWDHATLLYEGDEANTEIYALLVKLGFKVVMLDEEPTAESMSTKLLDMLNHKHKSDLRCVKIRLYETPVSYAEVSL